MSVKPIDLLGGESVYCINEGQLKSAMDLAYENPETAEKVQTGIDYLEQHFERNERAAVAFVVIDHLLKTSPGAKGGM